MPSGFGWWADDNKDTQGRLSLEWQVSFFNGKESEASFINSANNCWLADWLTDWLTYLLTDWGSWDMWLAANTSKPGHCIWERKSHMYSTMTSKTMQDKDLSVWGHFVLCLMHGCSIFFTSSLSTQTFSCRWMLCSPKYAISTFYKLERQSMASCKN